MESTTQLKKNIDRKQIEPAYLQLVNILTEQISNGDYQPGSRIPSETELCKQYRVSPMTVRRTIKRMSDLGIVNTIQGSGTYVRGPGLKGVSFGLEEFLKLFKEKEQTQVEVLEAMVVNADSIVADKLSIDEGDLTILIKRVLLRDGEPVIFHKEQLLYDPYIPIVEAELEVTNLQGLFVGNGETRFRRGELAIEATFLSNEEATVLNAISPQPAFRIEHIFYDLEDKPVSWGCFICRGDRLRFSAAVGLPPKAPAIL